MLYFDVTHIVSHNNSICSYQFIIDNRSVALFVMNMDIGFVKEVSVIIHLKAVTCGHVMFSFVKPKTQNTYSKGRDILNTPRLSNLDV